MRPLAGEMQLFSPERPGIDGSDGVTGTGNDKKRREEAIRQLRKLATGKVNDAVKLSYLTGEELECIDALDLSALTEFKRSGNGTVEIKLVDRVEVLEKLIALLEDRREDSAEAFFQALEAGEEREKP